MERLYKCTYEIKLSDVITFYGLTYDINTVIKRKCKKQDGNGIIKWVNGKYVQVQYYQNGDKTTLDDLIKEYKDKIIKIEKKEDKDKIKKHKEWYKKTLKEWKIKRTSKGADFFKRNTLLFKNWYDWANTVDVSIVLRNVKSDEDIYNNWQSYKLYCKDDTNRKLYRGIMGSTYDLRKGLKRVKNGL